jgi:hypothetical protein
MANQHMNNLKSKIVLFAIVTTLLVVVPIAYGLIISYGEWSGTSDRRYLLKGSTNQARATLSEASVQIYTARSARWRGVVSVHSWIATKAYNEQEYTRYEVIGWNRHNKPSYVVSSTGNADSYWYGYTPELIFELSGDYAQQVITKIRDAVRHYPYTKNYRAWPGPNSNTFTAYLARQIPELDLDLPPTAIGKDYTDGIYFGSPPSNRGIQFSWSGYIGLILSPQEGIEINLFGAVYGFDFTDLALKLPAIGRLPLL